MASDFISKTAEWVKGGGGAFATCLRCEDVMEPPALLVDYAALEPIFNGFAALHSRCRGAESEEPRAESQVAPVAVVQEEEPVRVVEDEVSAWVPTERSVARRMANGAVFIDCRIHGTRAATIRGNRAHCTSADMTLGGNAKCAESAEVPGKGSA